MTKHIFVFVFWVRARDMVNWPSGWGGGWMYGGAQGCKMTRNAVGPACTCVQCTGRARRENYVTGVTRALYSWGLIEWTSWEDQRIFIDGTGWVQALCTGVTNWGGSPLGLGMFRGLGVRLFLYIACDSQGPDKENAYRLWSLPCAVFDGCTYVRTACKLSYREKNLLLHEIYKIELNGPEIQTPRCNYSGSYRGALKIMILVWPW